VLRSRRAGVYDAYRDKVVGDNIAFSCAASLPALYRRQRL
jgi:hypothetical protein